MTIVATGPSEATRGSTVTYYADIFVDDGKAEVYVTYQGWPPDPTADPKPTCCQLLGATATAVSGQAVAIGPGSSVSQRWTIAAPGVRLRLDIRIRETTDFEAVTVGGYLTGTDVAQYQNVTPVTTQVTPVAGLPATGGAPLRGSHQVEAALAGVALLFVSLACVVVATRIRQGVSTW